MALHADSFSTMPTEENKEEELDDTRYFLVPRSQDAGARIAWLCVNLVNHATTITWLKANKHQIKRTFDLVNGAPFITCLDYPRIAHVLAKTLEAFEDREQQLFSQLLEQVDVVVEARQKLRKWHDQEALRKPDDMELARGNVKHEAFLKVMKEVRRILGGPPA